MKSLILFWLFPVVTLSQNILQNGTFEGKILADHWQVTTFVTHTAIDTGVQYIESHAPACPQSTIYQIVDKDTTFGKKYTLSFQIKSNEEIWVRYYLDDLYFIQLDAVQPGEYGFYQYHFTCQYSKIHKILFSTPAGHWCNLLIDNAYFAEDLPTGISQTVSDCHGLDSGIYSLSGQKLNSVPQAGYYIKNRQVHYKIN